MSKSLNILKRLRKGPVLALAGALAVAALLITTRPERPPITMPERSWSVSVVPARPAPLQPTLELYGRVESPQDAGLSAAVEAEVMELLVRDGEAVTAGQALLQLDDRDAQLDLLQRQADVREIQATVALERQRLLRNEEALDKEQELLALAEDNTARARSLKADGVLSQSDVDRSSEELKRQQLAVSSRQLAIEESTIRLDQLRAQLQRAEALRDRSQLTLERTRVTAPFAGLISNVEVSPGDRVSVGDSLMRLHNPDSLELRTQVPTRHVARVRDALSADQSLRAEVDVGGQPYEATLVRVSGQTREGSGAVDAFLRFDRMPGDTQLGATLRLLLALPAEPGAIALPAEALYGRNRIYKVEDGRMVSLDVERIGERTLPDGRSEVLVRSPALTPDDQIITTKVSTAADGVLVDIRGAGGGQSDASLLATAGAPNTES
jgi:RND family efflux transporter MFP subunit